MNTFHRKWVALWTHRHISYIAEEEKHFSHIATLLEKFENNYSRFKNQSTLTKLNTTKKLSTNEEFLKIINLWLHAYKETDGYFSMFVWTTLINLWYDQDYSFKEKYTQSAIWKDIYISNWEIILWKNTSIDIWWFWKGFLIDKIGKYFTTNGIENRIINGGWDILVHQENISIFKKIWLQHTVKKELLIWEVGILKWAITCSSIYERKRWHNHHLINPKTWKPVTTDISSIYVYCDNACMADIASTTLSVCWKENIALYAKRLWVEYIIIFDDDTLVYSQSFQGLNIYK